MYFDNIQDMDDYKFAGELFAINEFSEEHDKEKIVRLNNLEYIRIFGKSVWLTQMFWYIGFGKPPFTYGYHKIEKRVELLNSYL